MTRTITDTADRLRTCDMLTMDDTLRKQTPVQLPRIVLVEGIAACNTHSGCIAVAVADPNSSLSDQPAATLHVNPGYILTWTGDFSHAGSTGHRPGGVDLDQPAGETVNETCGPERPKTDLQAVTDAITRTVGAIADNPETYDTDAMWALLQAITDVKKVVDNELVRRMLLATKGA